MAMKIVAVKCPFCGGEKASKNGHNKTGKQVYNYNNSEWQVNDEYIRTNQCCDAIIVSSEQTDIDGIEMDEMWSFVHDKSQQYWLWWAIDHSTGAPLVYCFGTQEHKYLDKLRALLVPFNITIVYSDDNFAYKNRIIESTVITGKRNTQRIECKHCLCILGAVG